MHADLNTLTVTTGLLLFCRDRAEQHRWTSTPGEVTSKWTGQNCLEDHVVLKLNSGDNLLGGVALRTNSLD